MDELYNPLIKEHPYKPESYGEDGAIDPNRDMVLELELPHDLFAPGATSWNRMRFEAKKNLSDAAHRLIENFLALAEVAKSLSERHNQLKNVRLMYISVLNPVTFQKMKAVAGRSPKDMQDKNYSSHILRLVATPTEDMDPNRDGAHTFGNLQKVINSQKERLEMKEKNKRKRRRADEVDEEEEKEPIQDKWRKIAHLGIWEREELPLFLNPTHPRNNAPTEVYKYVHAASEFRYKLMVDGYLQAKSVEQLRVEGAEHDYETDDINHPRCSYNPINVFAPMSNFLRRVARLCSDREYSEEIEKRKDAMNRFNDEHKHDDPASARRIQRRKKKLVREMTELVQEEMQFDKWFALRRGSDRLVVQGAGPGDSEFCESAIQHLATPYNGETCWLLDINDFRASTFRHRLFPWAGRLIQAGVSLEKRAFIQNAPRIWSIPEFLLPHGVSSATMLLKAGEKDAMDRVLMEEKDLGDMYDQRINLKTSSGLGGVTLSGWADENRRRLAEAEDQAVAEAGENMAITEEFSDRRRELRFEALLNSVDEFEAKIHTSEMTASKARRSIAAWYDDLKSHSDEKREPCLLSFPRDHVHHSLSSLGDALAGEADELDSLFYVHEGHDRIITKLIAVLQIHIPFYIKDKPRPCKIHANFINQSREGSTAKSFTDEVVQKHMITGTYVVTDMVTPQFLSGSTAPPDEHGFIEPYHKMTLFMDELQQGLLESDVGNNNNNSMNSSGHAEMLKTVQTKGIFTVVMPILEKGKAFRSQGEIKSRCELCFFTNTNRSLTPYSHSSLSRNIVSYAKGYSASTDDRPDVTDKMSEESNISLIDLEKRSRRIQRWNRNQFVSSIVGQLIEGEVLTPINMSCADQVYRWVKAVAPQFHLTGFGTSRNFDIFRTLVQGLVLYELCHKMFDIPAAPFSSRPWTFRDALWFQKHLVSTTEHATLAFGMMRSSFEEEGLLLTVRLLYDWVYNMYIEGRGRVNTDIQVSTRYSTQEDQVLHRKYPMEDGSFYSDIQLKNPSAFNQQAHATDEQLLTKLTVKLLSVKTNRDWCASLTEDVIRRSLKSLTRRDVPVPFYKQSDRGGFVKQNRLKSCPLLRIDAQSVVLACLEPDVESEHSRTITVSASLPSALKHVLEHAYCNKRDFLYGTARSHMPHIFDVIPVAWSDRVLEISKSGGRKEPLTDDIDDHYVMRFNAKIDVGKCLIRVYPSNSPSTLMRQLYLFQTQYSIAPPYPTHDPLFFLDDHRAEIQLYNKTQKKQIQSSQLQQVGYVSEAQRVELQTQSRSLKNIAHYYHMRHQLNEFDKAGRGLTPSLHRLITEDVPEDAPQTDFLKIVQLWLRCPEHTSPIHHHLLRLSNPTRLWAEFIKRKSSKRMKFKLVPDHLEHPLTSMEMSKQTSALNRFMSLYHTNVKTMADFKVDLRDATLTLGRFAFRVQNSGLQFATARPSFVALLRKSEEEVSDDDEEEEED